MIMNVKGVELVRLLLKEHNLKVKELAFHMNVLPNQLSNRLNGRIPITELWARRFAETFTDYHWTDFLTDN